mgnify:CR=1 FL=1
MARSRRTTRALPPADPIYQNRLVTRLINRIMERGKKQTAQAIVYKAFEIIKSKGLDEVKTFETAVGNVGPKMEVRARRVGGASYQVPTEVRGDRRISLALRWITGYAHNRSNKEFKTYAEKLAAELMDAANNTGEAIKKRDTVLRNAEANRAFAHFKW